MVSMLAIAWSNRKAQLICYGRKLHNSDIHHVLAQERTSHVFKPIILNLQTQVRYIVTNLIICNVI